MGTYHTSLSHKEKYDAVIVLGKNIGIEWDRDRIAKSPDKLSTHSRISTLAAGMLYTSGRTKFLIFSGGKTSGPDMPSEARSMKKFLRSRFSYSQIPGKAVILEEESFSTYTNACEVKKIIEEYKLKNIALLTVGFHAKRAHMRFQKVGVTVSVLHAERVIFENSKLHRGYLTRYQKSFEVRMERVKEFIARSVVFFDSQDILLGSLLRITRTR